MRLIAMILWSVLLTLDLQEMHDHPGWGTYIGVTVAVCGVAIARGSR